ncbi:MAG: hypothetical protein ACXW27_03260 [Allosphingosinicella sp.]
MRLFTRYGLAGMGALALLSLVHWLRGIAMFRRSTVDYLLGVLPNFAAAIAIAFVLLSIWADRNRDSTFEAARRAYFACASISGLGLMGWEVFQKTSNRLVFDPHDVGATLVGIGMASLLFYRLTPRRTEPCRQGCYGSKTDHSG